MKFRGRAWKYGDNIDTDKIIPARYLNTSDPVELAKHCMEGEDPEFISKVAKGDILIAGQNFGCGSSREHAPLSIKYAGISGVIASSFARIFFRNSINIALPVVEHPQLVEDANTGDEIEVDFQAGMAKNITRNKEYKIFSFPEMVKRIIESGGLMNYAKRTIKNLNRVT